MILWAASVILDQKHNIEYTDQGANTLPQMGIEMSLVTCEREQLWQEPEGEPEFRQCQPFHPGLRPSDEEIVAILGRLATVYPKMELKRFHTSNTMLNIIPWRGQSISSELSAQSFIPSHFQPSEMHFITMWLSTHPNWSSLHFNAKMKKKKIVLSLKRSCVSVKITCNSPFYSSNRSDQGCGRMKRCLGWTCEANHLANGIVYMWKSTKKCIKTQST